MKKELYVVPGASPIALYNKPEFTGGDGRKTDRIFRGLSLVRKLCFNLFIFGQRREFLFSGEIPEV